MNLAQELQLRRRLFELRPDEVTWFVTPDGTRWTVGRDLYRFHVCQPNGKVRGLPRRQQILRNEFRIRRTISEILLMAYRDSALVPELDYPNVVRVGARYAACYLKSSCSAAPVVAYGTTPLEAYEGWEDWFDFNQQTGWLYELRGA